MAQEYTQGEWRVLKEDNHFAIRSEEDLCPIAETHHATTIDRANAHLISAAPNMYKALQKCRDYLAISEIGEEKKLVNKADKALSKAEGEEA